VILEDAPFPPDPLFATPARALPPTAPAPPPPPEREEPSFVPASFP
jgi:hypothetical protein